MLATALCLTACGGGLSPAASGNCWKRLLSDAYDGSIDASFAPGCYRAAIAHLPMDAYTPMRAVLQLGETQAVGDLVPPERSWASVRRSIRVGRVGARRALAEWRRSLADGQSSVTATRFRAPSRSWLLARLERLQTVYHFRVIGLRYLHRFRDGARPAPLLFVQADPQSFVPATRLVVASLDRQRRQWNYEAFFLEARDRFGAPYLAVFNNWRGPHPGGGQWARGAGLYPFPHG